MAVLLALAGDDPTPVRALNPRVPEALAQLVHQLLAKDPMARPQSAEEVAERLRTILEPPHLAPSVVPLDVNPGPDVVFANLGDAADDMEDVEATQADTAADTATPEPVQQKTGRKEVVIGGGAALALVLVAGAFFALKNRDRTEPGPQEPDTAAVPGSKDIKPVAPVEPPKDVKPVARAEPKVPSDPKPEVDPNRAAAEWALSAGVQVTIRTATGSRSVTDPKNLPAGPLVVTELRFSRNAQVGDDDLARLVGLSELTLINLAATGVKGPGLKYLARLPALASLSLFDTAVSDAGLEHLKGAPRLERLYLNNTLVTDAGLEHLAGLTALTQVSLHGTKVTPPAVAKLQRALPACKILGAQPKP
jgi:eukaryotic-like serine/threonine-protein kinase